MNRNLKSDLRQLYAAIPPPDAGNKMKLMDRTGACQPPMPRQTSLLWFIRSQLPFVSKPVLILQLLLLCLYGIASGVVLTGRDGYLLMVPMAPIVVLLGTWELARSYRWNMTELEIPSRFSLAQVLLARFVIAAVTDVLVLTVMLVTTAARTGYSFGALIVYGLVPSFMAAAGSLCLLQKSSPGAQGYLMAAYCLSLSVLGLISIEARPGWYDEAAITIWLLILVVSAGAFAAELWRLIKSSARWAERIDLA